METMGTRKELEERIRSLEAVIREVIRDAEDDEHWGPDVTVVGKLIDALNPVGCHIGRMYGKEKE